MASSEDSQKFQEMRKATVETKSNSGVYKRYTIHFKNLIHFDNWYNKISRYGKVIGVQFEDGKGEDGWHREDEFDNHNIDQSWNKIKGYNE